VVVVGGPFSQFLPVNAPAQAQAAVPEIVMQTPPLRQLIVAHEEGAGVVVCCTVHLEPVQGDGQAQ